MRILWLVSFRPIGKSKSNDLFQSIFVDSVKSLNRDVWFSLTQFNEANVKSFYSKKKKKLKIFLQIFQKKTSAREKYSNKIMLEKALDQYIYIKVNLITWFFQQLILLYQIIYLRL